MNPEQIREEVFQNQVSGWWVRRNVAPQAKIRFGHSTVFWYEADVHAWIETKRGA